MMECKWWGCTGLLITGGNKPKPTGFLYVRDDHLLPIIDDTINEQSSQQEFDKFLSSVLPGTTAVKETCDV